MEAYLMGHFMVWVSHFSLSGLAPLFQWWQKLRLVSGQGHRVRQESWLNHLMLRLTLKWTCWHQHLLITSIYDWHFGPMPGSRQTYPILMCVDLSDFRVRHFLIKYTHEISNGEYSLFCTTRISGFSIKFIHKNTIALKQTQISPTITFIRPKYNITKQCLVFCKIFYVMHNYE